MVTKNDVKLALEQLGVKRGDSLLVHSSFRSFGPVENGGETIVSAMLEVLGEEGTLVFPTLCQKDWEHVYENWHMDAPSDVGYLSNYFRKLPGARRSNQASHSVAAIGRLAEYFTETHGESGLRHGIFGDTCFSADSPWEKMYEHNTKTLFIGCWLRACTFRHLAEYQFMHKWQEKAMKSPRAKELIDRVWCYERWNDRGVWWHIDSLYVEELLAAENKMHYTTCGESSLKLVSSRDFVDLSNKLMDERDPKGFYVDNGGWDPQDTYNWLKEIESL